MPMTDRVYLAAPYDRRVEMRQVARWLEENCSYEVVGRWIHSDQDESKMSAMEFAEAAEGDLRDIDFADIFVLFAKPSEPGKGRFIELGYALASKNHRRIHVIGDGARPARPSIFMFLPEIHYHPTFESYKAWLAGKADRLTTAEDAFR